MMASESLTEEMEEVWTRCLKNLLMQQVEYLMEGRQEVMELLFEELGDGGKNKEEIIY